MDLPSGLGASCTVAVGMGQALGGYRWPWAYLSGGGLAIWDGAIIPRYPD